MDYLVKNEEPVLSNSQLSVLMQQLTEKGIKCKNAYQVQQSLLKEYGVLADIKAINLYFEPTIDELIEDKKTLLNNVGIRY